MLNHTYTSVHDANFTQCDKHCHGQKKQKVLIKENFLSEFKTELDKKKVLKNLGIDQGIFLEWIDVE